jgi:hypothetical protein
MAPRVDSWERGADADASGAWAAVASSAQTAAALGGASERLCACLESQWWCRGTAVFQAKHGWRLGSG